MTMFTSTLQLIAAVLTVATLSFIYKENPFYRWAEYTVIGVTTGNWLVQAINAIQNAALGPLQAGEFHVIIALILGALYFSRLVGKPWLYRYPIAVLTGLGVGFAIRGQPGVILAQVQGVMRPITLDLAGLGAITALAALVFGLTYFTYTIEHKGTIGISAKIGRYFIMAFVGQRFVGEVNAYITILVGRLVEFVLYLKGLF
jgi:hypothetical protein